MLQRLLYRQRFDFCAKTIFLSNGLWCRSWYRYCEIMRIFDVGVYFTAPYFFLQANEEFLPVRLVSALLI